MAKDFVMKEEAATVLSFPCPPTATRRRVLRDYLLKALRSSEFPVVVDLSCCHTLNHQDIDLLLDCLEKAAGQDVQVSLVAGSDAVRVLLEVTRISSLVHVCNSLQEAMGSSTAAGCSPAADAERAKDTSAA
jgi:anti-anti-sigma regulatory factor